MNDLNDDSLKYSPFSPDEAPGISLIVQMRIYDVLMAIYTELVSTDERTKQKARDLFEVHANGGIIGSLPEFDPSLLRPSNED